MTLALSMQATITVIQQIGLSVVSILRVGYTGCIRRVQRKEFVNTITDSKITKLLLKDCNCSNCVDVSNMGSDWCMHQKEKPENEVCVMWKEQIAPIKDFVKWAKEEFPNALPGKNSFLKLISKLYKL